ncbi:MAG: cysteine desulfurase/selenocysteine lyase [Candidatus Krumholzibacteriia bacterium]|jgi:cysteine desulfurase/selenocysteine lyase
MKPLVEGRVKRDLDWLRAGGAHHDFPLLCKLRDEENLVFLDSGASSQKPQSVIDTLTKFYSQDYANIHRGVYRLSQEATRLYEGARAKVQQFLGAQRPEEIVFVRGTTEGINLLANSFVRPRLNAGDEILITQMEHHSNIVPWQLLCESTGASLKFIPLTDTGELQLELLPELLTDRTRVLAITHVSNALGTINPLREIIRAAHDKDVPVIVDGAQAVHHMTVDVQDLDCDFYVFSGHKLYGPTGAGAVYGKQEHWESMPPWHGGGDMIVSVTLEKSTFADPPTRFEAGTPDIAGAVGLGAAIDYVNEIGMENVVAFESEVFAAGTEILNGVPGLRMIGTAAEKAAVFSFVLDGVHPHDVGTFLDTENVAVRTGHHCAQPIMDYFKIPATTRASLGIYNTVADIERLAEGLVQIRKFFRV